jgi:membrane dipeptidase
MSFESQVGREQVPVFVGHSDFITALAGYDTKPALVAGTALELLTNESDPERLGAFASALASHSPRAEEALREKAERLRNDSWSHNVLESFMRTDDLTEHNIIEQFGGSRQLVPDANFAIRTGLSGGFFEVFATPPINTIKDSATEMNKDGREPQILERSYALDKTIAGIGILLRLERQSLGSVRIARSARDLTDVQMGRIFVAILHLADADAIDTDLDTLDVLYAAGVRSIAITWSRSNAFGCGVPFRVPGTPDIGPGLTEAGVRLVKACNELGIVIDLAHLNEAGFWDVVKHTQAPLVVTHGASHTLTPTSRAYTDRQLAAIAESSGIIGISLEGVQSSPKGIVADMIRQIDYMVDHLGPDSVAVGSDLYRGPGSGQQAVAHSLIPDLLKAMRRAGYDRSVIEKIAYRNWWRVLSATWEPET